MARGAQRQGVRGGRWVVSSHCDEIIYPMRTLRVRTTVLPALSRVVTVSLNVPERR